MLSSPALASARELLSLRIFRAFSSADSESQARRQNVTGTAGDARETGVDALGVPWRGIALG